MHNKNICNEGQEKEIELQLTTYTYNVKSSSKKMLTTVGAVESAPEKIKEVRSRVLQFLLPINRKNLTNSVKENM